MITIDNTKFAVGIVSIERKASFKQNSLGTTLDLMKHYDVQGTYFDYDVVFNVKGMKLDEYNKLYEKITDPVEHHIVTLPYADTEITFKAHLKISSDKIVFDYTKARKWGGLKVSFEALEPQKVVDA